MKVSNEILGTWRIPSVIAPDREEVMYVGGEGRIVHFVFSDSNGSRVLAMKLWVDPVGGDRYRVRLRLGDEGWMVGLIPTESGMTIEREEVAFHLTPALESELPDWYAARLARALQEMWKCEVDHKAAEQAAASGGDQRSV